MGKPNETTTTDSKRVILNESNYPVWKRLTLTQIGSRNARTLKSDFKPHKNRYKRPLPPKDWLSKLEEVSDGSSSSKSEEDEEHNEEGKGKKDEIENDESETTGNAKASSTSFKDYERVLKVWQIEEDRATVDSNAMKETMLAIRGGMSKSMQTGYSSYTTPAALWAELKRTRDPIHRKLDTSAADTYRAMSIRENQSIPDYLKLVRETEDICEAAGETLHHGLPAQKTIRLKLDHRFAQAVMMLSVKEYSTLEDFEKDMVDLWDGYRLALERNVPKPKVNANVTVTAGNNTNRDKHKREASNDNVLPRKMGKYDKCNNCSGHHNPKFDCDACWSCGKRDHLSRTCPNKKKRGGGNDQSSTGSGNGTNGGSSSSQSNSEATSAAAAVVDDNKGPKQIGWTPSRGLL
ncbi:hypothetical protein HDU98_001870 [Podochytrium sp. JEL0797]|nr:hypothetical protein HDU98_001870 [Podochytrium sp. JEL0797]